MSVANRTYCRFCAALKSVDEIYNLAVYSSIRSTIQEKLVFFNISCIDLDAEDALPKTICCQCYKNIEKAHNFILETNKSQSILSNLFIENGAKLLRSFHENQTENSEVNIEDNKAKKIKQENLVDCKVFPQHEFEFKVENAECGQNYSDVSSLSIESPVSGLDVDHNLVFYCSIPVFRPDQPTDEGLDNSWSGYPWQCKYCEKFYTDIHLLREHFKSAHDVCSAYKCADCGESFTFFEAFVEHVKGHRPLLRNYCEYCNIKLEPALQDKHKKKHYKEKKCQHCGNIFNSAHYQRDHINKYQPKRAKLNTNSEVKKKRKKSKPIYVMPVKEIEKIHDKSWTAYPWICFICDSSFANVDKVREHSKDMHGKCFAMKCVDCSELLDGYRRFVFHVRRHRPYLKSYCHYCNANFGNESELDHVAGHFNASQRLCEGCGEIFNDKTELKQHQDIYKPIQPQPIPYIRRERPLSVDDLTCDVCNKICVNINSLRQHKTLHTERKREFTCDRSYCHYCNANFGNESELDHVAGHFNASQRLCEGCGEIFNDKTELKQHQDIYKPIQPQPIPYIRRERPLSVDDLTCDVCNKICVNINSLRQHKTLHTERKREFTCDRCGNAYYSKSSLEGHYQVHQAASVTCEICKKTFKSALKLKYHVKTHFEARQYECDSCTRKFKRKCELRDHFIVHTNEMPYSCFYCEKAFKRKHNLVSHERQHTGARPYECTECTMDFTNWANCNKHMKRKHGTTLAQSVMTPNGKLPLNPKSGRPKKIRDLETVKEWTDQVLAPKRKGKKRKKANSVAVTESVAQ